MKTHIFFLALAGLLLFSPVFAQAQDTNALDLDSLAPITTANGSAMTEIRRIGRGYLTGNATWSPDGKLAAVSSSLGVWLYNTLAPQDTPQLLEHPHQERVQRVVFSPDSRSLAALEDDKIVRLWDVRTGTLRRTPLERLPVSNILFRDDGVLIAYRISGGVLFQLRPDNALNQIVFKSDNPFYYPFARRGNTLIGVPYDTTTIVEINSDSGALTERSTLPNPDHYFNAVNLSPDGSKAATIGQGTDSLRIWDTTSGTPILEIPEVVYARKMAFSPDSQRIAVSTENEIHLWDVTTGKRLRVLSGHIGTIENIEFSPDGQRLLSTGNFTASDVRVWDTMTGQQLALWQEPDGTASQIDDLAFSPDGTTLATITGGLQLWDVSSLLDSAPLNLHPHHILGGGFMSVAFSPDGKLVAAGGDQSPPEDCECTVGMIDLFDTETGQMRAILTGWGGQMYVAFTDVAFSADGAHLASIEWELGIWDTKKALRQGHLDIDTDMSAVQSDPQYMAWSVDFSPRESLLAYARSRIVGNTDFGYEYGDHQIVLWDVNSNTEIRHLEGQRSPINKIAFSPDGQFIASGSGEIVGNKSNDEPIYGDDNSICLWDVQTGQLKFKQYHDSMVLSVAFSPDGSLLASGDFGGSIHIMDVATGEDIAVLTGHIEAVNSLAFSPDGKLLASGGRDSTIRLWGVPRS